MDYNVGAAIGAGLVGTAAMTVVLYMGIWMFPRQMTMNLLYMLGTMVTRNRNAAYLTGTMMHVGMGIMFALVHVAIYQAADIETSLAVWGLLFGLGHWMMAGMGMGMGMGMVVVGSVHQLMRSGELAAPGLFVKDYPAMTAMGFLMLHLLYGLLVGVLYQAWV